MLFYVSVVIMMTSYTMALQGIYHAKKAGLINGDYVFIMFELDPMLAGYKAASSVMFSYLPQK